MMIDRSKKPGESGRVSFELPEVQSLEIKGVNKCLFVQKSNLPIIKFNLIFNSGSMADPEGKYGLTYLTALLIDEGAGPYDALQLADEFEFLGSEFSISVTEDSVIFSILALKEHFERTLELLSFIIKSPRLSQPDFDREKKTHLAKLIQLNNQPDFTASNIFQDKIFAGSPYAHSPFGKYEDVELTLLNEVRSFYEDAFFSPSIAVAGNISPGEFEHLFHQYFEGAFKDQKSVIEFPSVKSKAKSIFLYDIKDSAQAEIRFGHASNIRERDFFAKLLLNAALGGQFSSRLMHNLREVKGYTYGIHSSFGYNQRLGSFEIGTAVDIKNVVPAAVEIRKEIEAIKSGISSDELAFVKAFLTKRFPAQFETYSNIATNLTTQIIHNLPDDYYKKYLPEIESVSSDEITEAAVKRINPDEMQIVIAGDAEQASGIKDQFPDYSIFMVNKLGEILEKVN